MRHKKYINSRIEVYDAHRIRIGGDLYAAPSTGAYGNDGVIVYVENDAGPMYIGWIQEDENEYERSAGELAFINEALKQIGKEAIKEGDLAAGWTTIVGAYGAAIDTD